MSTVGCSFFQFVRIRPWILRRMPAFSGHFSLSFAAHVPFLFMLTCEFRFIPFLTEKTSNRVLAPDTLHSSRSCPILFHVLPLLCQRNNNAFFGIRAELSNRLIVPSFDLSAGFPCIFLFLPPPILKINPHFAGFALKKRPQGPLFCSFDLNRALPDRLRRSRGICATYPCPSHTWCAPPHQRRSCG